MTPPMPLDPNSRRRALRTLASGLAGAGDVIATCSSRDSRNHRVGAAMRPRCSSTWPGWASR